MADLTLERIAELREEAVNELEWEFFSKSIQRLTDIVLALDELVLLRKQFADYARRTGDDIGELRAEIRQLRTMTAAVLETVRESNG